jgi:multiple sugar transport system permease protein
VKNNNTLYAYIMSSPTMLILTALSIFPLGFVIWYSMTDYYYLSTSAPEFVGFANYTKVINDPYFRQALWNTLKFTVLAVLFEVAIGLGMAVLINSVMKQQKLIRTTTLLPMLLPPVTVALIWQIMLSNNYGLLNNLLEMFGLAPVNWLMDVKTAFYAILVIDIWQYTPFAFLLLYAALQSIPSGQYEAASIDGAGAWKQFVHITIPNITVNVIMVVLLRVIDTFRLFDKVNILTKGGPSNSTATITQYIYQYGVKMLQVGLGSSASVIMTILVLILAFGYIRRNFKRTNTR